jgi:hypothetical protein
MTYGPRWVMAVAFALIGIATLINASIGRSGAQPVLADPFRVIQIIDLDRAGVERHWK